jgi:hypothetical protein
MRGIILAVGAVLLLAGCAKPLEVGSITEIKPPPGTQGVDVYAGRRAAGEKVPDFAGDQLMEVRTFATSSPDGGGTGDEFSGASCKLSARDFSADVTTPAKVRVPVYRAQSSPLAVQCTKEGFKPKMTEVTAFNQTKLERHAGGAGGLVGFLVVTAINAASDETTHDFKYPVARVEMEPVALGKVAAAQITKSN